MQVLEILLEENALGSVRPVEVVANVPVSLLVPALVEELNLPQTDSYGRQLAYRLCSAFEGRVFVLPETCLRLLPGEWLYAYPHAQ